MLDPGGIAISTSTTGRVPAVGFDGTKYFVAWEDWRDEWSGALDTYGARISQAGSLLDPAGIPMIIAQGRAETSTARA